MTTRHHDDAAPRLCPPGTDGWVRQGRALSARPRAGERALARRPLSASQTGRLTQGERASRARASAVLCHMSVVCGFPIFLIAFVARDDAFVLHHAKASALAFALFYGLLCSGLMVSWVFFLAMLATYLFPLVGIWRARAGERAGLLGLGPQGDGVFFLLSAKPKPAALIEDEA